MLLNGTREEKDITLTSPLVIARLYQLARALSEGCLILNVHIESSIKFLYSTHDIARYLDFCNTFNLTIR